MNKLTIEEVAAQLRKAVTGEVPMKIMGGETWDEIYCGNVTFMFGDWEIVFFNDCWELDYVDSATAPDGRTGEFDDWCGDNIDNPLNRLNIGEQTALEMMVEKLQPEVASLKA